MDALSSRVEELTAELAAAQHADAAAAAAVAAASDVSVARAQRRGSDHIPLDTSKMLAVAGERARELVCVCECE